MLRHFNKKGREGTSTKFYCTSLIPQSIFSIDTALKLYTTIHSGPNPVWFSAVPRSKIPHEGPKIYDKQRVGKSRGVPMWGACKRRPKICASKAAGAVAKVYSNWRELLWTKTCCLGSLNTFLFVVFFINFWIALVLLRAMGFPLSTRASAPFCFPPFLTFSSSFCTLKIANESVSQFAFGLSNCATMFSLLVQLLTASLRFFLSTANLGQ